MTFGYPSARYLLSQHHTHFGHSESANSAELDSILNRSSSQSPLPDEAYLNLFDTVPYIFSSPTAVDVLAQSSPRTPVAGHLPDGVNISAWTAANSVLSNNMDNMSASNPNEESPPPSARPRTAPPSSLLALFNSDNFDALAHRIQVPLSPELVGTMSREETRTLLADDMEAMLRLGHAVEGEPRTYRQAWVDVPSDPEDEDEEEAADIAPPAEGGATWAPSFPLSIDPHLRLPRRHGRPRRQTAARASQTATAAAGGDDDDDEHVPLGLNPFLSSNLDALDAFLSHLPPLSPSSGVTASTNVPTSSSFSHFRRRPMMQSQQPNDQPSATTLRTITGAFSMLPDVPLSPLHSYALPSMGAYTHHVDSPQSPAASSTHTTGMPHPGDMTVMDLARRDPCGAHLHWDDVQAVARAERERHLRHLDRYGGTVERGVVVGGAVATAEWEAKMIR